MGNLMSSLAVFLANRKYFYIIFLEHDEGRIVQAAAAEK
jgi:hypothetical protein